jgi:hypothetical protein
MAAHRLIAGKLREIWQDAVGQPGGPPVPIQTDIKISRPQFSRIRGRLFVDGIVGAPLPAVGNVAVGANGCLSFDVANGIGGSSFRWTLDVELTHSIQQGMDPVPGAQFQVISGILAGIPAAQTLAQTYDFGAASVDQTMVLDTAAKGGGVIIDGSTASVTADGVSLEIRQNAFWSIPTMVRRTGDIVAGPVLRFDRSRGSFAVPLSVQDGDIVGTIDFTANAGALGVQFAGRIQVPVVSFSEGGLSETAIDYSVSLVGVETKVWRMDHNNNSATGRLIGYGVEDSDISSILQFVKGRGTLAAPTSIQTNDALGVIDFRAYAGGSYNSYAQIRCQAINVGAGPGFLVRSALDFYASYDSAEASLFEIRRLSAAGAGVFECIGDGVLQPAVNNQGYIGTVTGTSWKVVAAYNIYSFANVLIGDYTDHGANHTLGLTNDSTMPVPTANRVFLGSKDWTGSPFGGIAGAVFEISAEALVQPSGAQAADTLIPIRYNGVNYVLLAFNATPG